MSIEELYQAHKGFLVSLAYRMLSSVMDAEDVVHNVFLTLDASALPSLQNPRAYLCRLVTNRCIDQLRSARVRRESYVGPWLPEPWIESRHSADDSFAAEDPLRSAVMKETLSIAFLLLLERLSPVERSVYVLREAYALDYDEIADATGKTAPNCRQIYRRAKLRIDSARNAAPHGDTRPGAAAAGEPAKSALVERFLHALGSGNVGLLSQLLNKDISVVSDGGGKVRAAVKPLIGRDRAMAFLLGIVSKTPEGFRVLPDVINGQPGLVLFQGDAMTGTVAFRFEGEQIADIYLVLNPEKLPA
ncbi:RNA polymerase sigma factor SigJ [Paenibacillus alkalitolerans]|uniref:RNA polymerase sigma factor SigJ n=1 Tax=Paenibacillus alkalitolerans TaxID=2799335 RepID=UPI0018F2D908|nr:RNA polymerase sigma factor SigJ [Paenibacillus alkalitolerans]